MASLSLQSKTPLNSGEKIPTLGYGVCSFFLPIVFHLLNVDTVYSSGRRETSFQ
jgi:hypothetical protein